MRRSGWTPSIVPNGDDHNVYLVVDDFGRNGRAWREADVEATDLETVILDMLEGQYRNPVRVVGFNTAEGWSQDVSADVAQELRRRCDLQMRDVPSFFKTSSIDTKVVTATCSSRCLCGWSEPWRFSVRSRPRSASRRPIPASSNRHWRPRSTRCPASAGSTRSSSTATGCRSTSSTTAVKIFTRRGNDWTNRFKKIAADAWHINAGSAIIDGEVVVPAADGTTDFSVLQNELKGQSTKIVMVAFDLLYLNGYDLRKLPLFERKALLKKADRRD